MPGYVYAITTVANEGAGLVKIGMTDRPVHERLKELNRQTAAAEEFYLVRAWRRQDPAKDETRIHRYLAEYRVDQSKGRGRRKEWFRAPDGNIERMMQLVDVLLHEQPAYREDAPVAQPSSVETGRPGSPAAALAEVLRLYRKLASRVLPRLKEASPEYVAAAVGGPDQFEGQSIAWQKLLGRGAVAEGEGPMVCIDAVSEQHWVSSPPLSHDLFAGHALEGALQPDPRRDLAALFTAVAAVRAGAVVHALRVTRDLVPHWSVNERLRHRIVVQRRLTDVEAYILKRVRRLFVESSCETDLSYVRYEVAVELSTSPRTKLDQALEFIPTSHLGQADICVTAVFAYDADEGQIDIERAPAAMPRTMRATPR